MTEGPKSITWDWLGRAVAGVVLAGIPALIGLQLWRGAQIAIIQERQNKVIEELAAHTQELSSLRSRMTFFRSEQDTGWQEIRRDILSLQVRLEELQRRRK